MTERRPEISEIQETLKHLMIARKLTLSDMAPKLGISIATAKRLLNGDDLSFERVLEICDWLGIRFHELVEIATQRRTEYHYCTPEQEEFLAKNPPHFAFLRALQKGDSLSALGLKFNLSLSDRNEYLKDLEDQGFLEITADSSVNLIVRDGMDWRPGGPLWNRFFGQWMKQFADHASRKAGVDERCIVEVSQRKLTAKAFEEMKRELDELSRKYASVSRLERELQPADSLDYYSCLIFADRWTAPIWDVMPYRMPSD